jgi:rhamnosyltransferase
LNKENIGLAKAINQGINFALERFDSNFFILFDQDSKPDLLLPKNLAIKALEYNLSKLACIGPALVDIKSKLKKHQNFKEVKFKKSLYIPTSGTLIPKKSLMKIGLMIDDLFIDGIDYEWCFRASKYGFDVITSTKDEMLHNMGDDGFNYFGSYKPLHRSPVRHYYIIRNSLFLLRLTYIPISWKLFEFLKTFRRCIFYIFISRNKIHSIILIFKAISDGYRMRMGKLNFNTNK